ncbi:hypothetical protein [uncultured Thiothrix sp.]|uniref:alpha/beta hydrolase family protein n=1 Tax=uncultured Thiothrix sp. TaxID=223185 RepID=UPI002620721A|nr:hypothetical protein [uncultured Thiothrix sp.]
MNLYFKIRFPTLGQNLAFSILCATSSTYAADIDLPAYKSLTFSATHRPKPINASLWYPAAAKTSTMVIGENAIFYGRSAYKGAGIAAGKYPLVIISHGSGGNMDGLAWLSSGLAQAGAIVLLMNHQGTMTGDSSPQRTILFEERVADLRAALDQILQNPQFAPHIDTQQISALGFSLGGAAVLQLAGVNFDRKAYADYCERLGKAAVDCLFLSKGGVDVRKLPDTWEQSFHEPRIGKIIAVEPGFSYAMTEKSLKSIQNPVLLISLGNETQRWKAADLSETGSNIINLIPQSEHATFAPAHHFTFLPECKPKGEQILAEENDDPICTDPAGTNRAQIHQQIIAKVSQFLGLPKLN